MVHQRNKRIFLGSLSLFGSTGITLAVGLILAGLLARYFSPEEFGLWSILMSLNGIMIIGFDLGFGNALRNKLAQLCGIRIEGDSQSPTYFFSVFYWFILCALILIPVLFLFKEIIPWNHLFRSDSALIISEGSSLLTIGACILAFNIAFNLYTSGFFAYQESQWNALLSGVSRLALLLITIFFVITRMNFYWINMMFFLIILIASAFSFHFFLRTRKWRWKKIPLPVIWNVVKELWGQSAQFALLQVFSIFLLNADYFIVSKILGLEIVGEYFLVKRIYLVLASFHFAILLPIWSAYTEAVESRDFDWVRKVLRETVFYTLIIFVAGIIGMLLGGNYIIYIWTGKEIDSPALFGWLGIWGLIYGWNNCFSVFLNGTGNLKRQVFFVGLGSAAFVPLSLLWGEKYGIVGVCLALIVVSLPVAVSNPVESMGILQRFVKPGMIRPA